MRIDRKAASPLALAIAMAWGTAAAAQTDGAVEELVVTGQRLSQQRAIETKREAVTVVDAISADEIGRLADKNVAENVERLPGVGLAYDQGEGRYVSIRGTPSALNNVTLNHVEVGNPDGDSRALPLDVVSGQLLGRVEVVKAVTPDYDAQGIGGTINLVSQSPFDFGKDRIARATLQVGYQEFNDKTPIQGDATVGAVFGEGRFGVLFGINGSSRDYRSDGLYPDDWRTVPGVARGGLPTNIKYTNYRLKRERIGAAGTLEFRPTDDDRLYLRGLYSRFTEDEYRQRWRLDFAANLANVTLNSDGATGVARNVDARQDLRLEYKEKSISSYSLGGVHERGPWSAEYDLSYGYNKLVEPNELWQFRQTTANLIVDFDMRPLLYTAEARNASPAGLGFRQHTRQDESGEETNIAGRLDLRRELDVGVGSYLKLGVKVRDTDKAFDGRTDQYDRAGAGPNRFTLADFGLQGPVMEVDTGDYVYFNRYTIDADAIREFTAANINGPRFVRNTATSLSNDTLNDYDLKERVSAGYVMADVDFGGWRLIGGWRVEHTRTEVDGFRLSGSTVTPVGRESTYTTFLPNLHLRFEPREDTILRAAYTRTLGRPQYPQMKPGGALVSTPLDNGTFEGELGEGNVDLKPYLSDNFDLTAEWYFAPGGLLAAGGLLEEDPGSDLQLRGHPDRRGHRRPHLLAARVHPAAQRRGGRDQGDRAAVPAAVHLPAGLLERLRRLGQRHLHRLQPDRAGARRAAVPGPVQPALRRPGLLPGRPAGGRALLAPHGQGGAGARGQRRRRHLRRRLRAPGRQGELPAHREPRGLHRPAEPQRRGAARVPGRAPRLADQLRALRPDLLPGRRCAMVGA
ncbi:TonB-dependent receptor [Phenylobacterium sp. J367]|nr:TonB-dependent receptor [Phenylobacterium sp. J367]MCR5877210.1 TonB-dependent receptor [Phenylobacterium sp. J367]